MFPEAPVTGRPADEGSSGRRRRFWTTVFTLGSASVAVYAVGAASAPFLGRIFGPAEFGEYAIWTALASMVGAVGTFRVELLLFGESDDRAALGFLIAGLAGAVVAASLLTGAIMLLASTGEPVDYVLAGSLALGNSVVALTTAGALRSGQVRPVAVSRSVRALVTVAGSLALGILWPSSRTLMIATCAGSLLSSAYLLPRIVDAARLSELRAAGWRSIQKSLQSHAGNRRSAILASMVSNFSSQLPVLMVGSLAGVSAAGTLGLIRRTVGAATSWVGSAVADGLKTRLSARELPRGEVATAYREAFRPLLIGALVVMATLTFTPDGLISAVLGPMWAGTSHVLRDLAAWTGLALLASPLSVVLIVRRKFAADLAWQVTNLALLAGGCFAGWRFWGEPGAIVGLGAAGAVSYAIYVALSYRVAMTTESTPPGEASPSGEAR